MYCIILIYGEVVRDTAESRHGPPLGDSDGSLSLPPVPGEPFNNPSDSIIYQEVLFYISFLSFYCLIFMKITFNGL